MACVFVGGFIFPAPELGSGDDIRSLQSTRMTVLNDVSLVTFFDLNPTLKRKPDAAFFASLLSKR